MAGMTEADSLSSGRTGRRSIKQWSRFVSVRLLGGADDQMAVVMCSLTLSETVIDVSATSILAELLGLS